MIEVYLLKYNIFFLVLLDFRESLLDIFMINNNTTTKTPDDGFNSLFDINYIFLLVMLILRTYENVENYINLMHLSIYMLIYTE